jgi:iron complex outermembrane receptor protein
MAGGSPVTANGGGIMKVLHRVSCTVLMSLSATGPLLAAETEQPGEAPVLEEVTVHAQRRQENLQAVPITVDTVSGADALQRGTTSIQTLAATIPNLTFTTASFATNTYIRGVGDNSASPNNEPSAAVYVDGVYNPASMALTSFNFNNIEQIEVLKGPQGTLFGRNATAGVIQILTPDPKHDLSGKVDAGYGNYNTISADSYITGGLTDKIAGDLAILYNNQMDGYGHNLSFGTPTFRSRDAAARSKWLFEPGAATKIRVTADYARFSSDGTSNQFVPGSFGPYPGRYNSLGRPTLNNNTQWGASVRVDQDIGEWGHGVSITSYREVNGELYIDSDLTPKDLNQISSRYDSHYITQELQLTNRNPGRITWLVGAFFYGNQVFGSDPRIQTGTQIKNGYTGIYGVQNTASGSIFGQGPADLGWATKLTLGLRYTDEELKAAGKTLNAAGGLTSGPFNQFFISRPLTWRVAVDHQFTQDWLGYVSFNRGFKSGGYNLASPGSAPFFPEHVDAY